LTAHLEAGRVILAIAMVAGIAVRFYRLDAISMTADEGAAWAAAAEPISRLRQLQPQFDSGKLALYDLLLHYWMGIFGASLRSLRSLSAALGTTSILLVFAVVRELCQYFAEEPREIGELAGGFAALIFATNVVMVDSARTARMYPLMTATELAHIIFFVRAQRHGGMSNCVLTAVFLALAIAANFTAIFLVAAESIWISYLLLARWRRWPGVQLRMAGPAFSIVAGLALLMPFVPGALAVSRAAIRGGAYDWIRYQPPLIWSYQVLHDEAGNRMLFRLLLALAIFSIWRHRRNARLATIFLAVVIIGPFAAVALLSLLGRPMMVDRYVLVAQIGFLALAATGAAAFSSKPGRILVFLLITWLSARALRHASGFWVDWRRAVVIACTSSSDRSEISVVPGYARSVVQYYLPPERRSLVFGLDSECGSSQILIVSPGRPIPPAYMSELNRCYPHLLGRATRVEVRAR
jgi:uncharacterized membrane protein